MVERVLRDREGLYGKYEVLDSGGYEVTDCFVLRPERDATALAALMHYAALTPNSALAADLDEWIERIQQKV